MHIQALEYLCKKIAAMDGDVRTAIKLAQRAIDTSKYNSKNHRATLNVNFVLIQTLF